MADDLSEKINQAAQAPKSVTVDGTSVQQQSIDDLIKAEQFRATKAATANSRSMGLRFIRVIPPGSV